MVVAASAHALSNPMKKIVDFFMFVLLIIESVGRVRPR